MPLSPDVPETRNPAPGVDLLCIPTRRFKRPGIWVHFDHEGGEGNAARTLVAKVLQQGTSALPSRRHLAAELESLWGGGFRLGGRRVGDLHRTTLGLRWTAPSLLPPDAGDLTGPSMDLGRAVLDDPRRGQGGEFFPGDVVEREKGELLREIEVLPEDRSAWADEIFLARMCKGEPCATPPWGSEEDVQGLGAEALEEARQGFLASAKITVIAVGPVDFSALETLLASWLGDRDGGVDLAAPTVPPAPGSLREIRQDADVDQARFRMGFRAPGGLAGGPREAQALASAILGGGSQGRLFRIIREERSLAYGIYASLQPYKGLLVVEAGIDGSSYEEVRDEVLRQVENLASSGPNEEELTRARTRILQRWEGLEDTAPGLGAYWGGERLLGTMSSTAERAETLNSVEADAVAEAATTWLPDLAFILGPEEGK